MSIQYPSIHSQSQDGQGFVAFISIIHHSRIKLRLLIWIEPGLPIPSYDIDVNVECLRIVVVMSNLMSSYGSFSGFHFDRREKNSSYEV